MILEGFFPFFSPSPERIVIGRDRLTVTFARLSP